MWKTARRGGRSGAEERGELGRGACRPASGRKRIAGAVRLQELVQQLYRSDRDRRGGGRASGLSICPGQGALLGRGSAGVRHACKLRRLGAVGRRACRLCPRDVERCRACARSEEHTSELQSLMRISYAVFCLKKK